MQPLTSRATRQEASAAMPATSTGATAQPSVPPTVCTLKARAIRLGAT